VVTASAKGLDAASRQVPISFMPFPLPWTARHNESAYWVEDANGRRFGFVYFHDRPLAGTGQEAYQTRDEARRLVNNFAKLPGLLREVPTRR
jgi:hypothetical protein